MALLLEGSELVTAVQSWLTQQLSPEASWQLALDGLGVRWPTGRVEPQTRWWQRMWIRLFRITSYNVCYTKLLRFNRFRQPAL